MTLPFTSLPKNDSRGTAQQRILDLEVVILLYSYNPVHSYRTVETFTSLSKYRSSKSIFPLKFHPMDHIRDRDLIRGYLTILDSTNFHTRWSSFSKKKFPSRGVFPSTRYASLQWLLTFKRWFSPSGWVAARALQNSSQGRSRLSTWVPRNTNLFLVWE